jgi:hypothetical protein
LSSTRFEQPVLCNVSGLRNRMDRLLPFSHRQRKENMRIGLISPKSRRPLQRSIYKSASKPLSVSIGISFFEFAFSIRRTPTEDAPAEAYEAIATIGSAILCANAHSAAGRAMKRNSFMEERAA